MSNEDVNAVVLRLALTLRRCGEDPGVVFAALIAAAATVANDLCETGDATEDFRRAVESVIAFGDVRAVRPNDPREGAEIIPFRPARVA